MSKHPLSIIATLTLVTLANPIAAQTSMDTVAKNYPHPVCRQGLSEFATDEIRVLPHRLHSLHQTYTTNAEGLALSPFSAFGTVQYNDRPMTVNFLASPVSATRCDIQMTRQYVLDDTCLGLREDSFKRWDFQGKLSNDVYVFKHRRAKNETAYLSNHGRGKQCLIVSQKTLVFGE
ncbi:MAG: hypothetical protein CR978_01600 [Gammaproteobacteria bacterium]|nr:MAG: hypothetical protein CR978_01600 [Gammaproteobacteria bacterium]